MWVIMYSPINPVFVTYMTNTSTNTSNILDLPLSTPLLYLHTSKKELCMLSRCLTRFDQVIRDLVVPLGSCKHNCGPPARPSQPNVSSVLQELGHNIPGRPE